MVIAKKYKTKIEITSPASSKDEAMEIVGDYLSGNIASGIDMRCTTKQVRFYDNTAAKAVAIVLLVTIGFLFSNKADTKTSFTIGNCQTAAVQPPLKTSSLVKGESKFKQEWEEKSSREVLDFIKK